MKKFFFLAIIAISMLIIQGCATNSDGSIALPLIYIPPSVF